MKKISENIIIKSKDGILSLIQTGDDFTIIESKPTQLEEAYVCVNSEKFLSVYSDESILVFNNDYLEVKTNKLSAKLPYMKSFGVFNTEKEIEFPSDFEIVSQFDKDFSKVDLELVDALDQYSYILFNQNFICRYLNNTLSFYGKIEDRYFNITPRQFKLLKTLGNCKVTIIDGLMKAEVEGVMLILRLYQQVIDLNLIKRFFNDDHYIEFILPEFDVKSMKLFLKDSETFSIIRKENRLSFYTDSFSNEYDIQDFSSDSAINLKIYKKDLDNMKGHLKIYFNSGMNYIISNPEEDKTVLFICDR